MGKDLLPTSVFLAAKKFFLLLVSLLSFSVSSYAQLPDVSHLRSQPKKIGLVLGGGGAKGAATVGALKVIERAGIRFDYIAGTSIGAIIGGLYASGYSVNELETLILSQEWEDVLQGHRVEALLKKLFTNRGISNFEDTRIPFKCVATQYWTLKEVDFGSGDIVRAIRASMSIPELYEPVTIDDVEYVDGGMVNNLPVDVVLEMGANRVIAIDLEQDDDTSLGLALGQGGLVDWVLSRPDVSRYRINLEDVDIHIHPYLPDFTAMSFGRGNCEYMMQLGEKEAQDHWDELLNIKRLQKK